MAGTLRSKAGSARQRAASRPTHPSRSLAAAASNGRIWRQSRGLIGSPRLSSSSRITFVSLASLVDGTDSPSLVPLGPSSAAEPSAKFVNTSPSIVGRLDLGPQPRRGYDPRRRRGWSPLFFHLRRREQHARRPLRALIDPSAQQRDLVRAQRGGSVPHGPGRHFRLGHLTRHVVDQRTLLAVSGNNGCRPGCAAFQNGIPTINAEKATRLFSTVAGDTRALQERFDLLREIDLLHILHHRNRG